MNAEAATLSLLGDGHAAPATVITQRPAMESAMVRGACFHISGSLQCVDLPGFHFSAAVVETHVHDPLEGGALQRRVANSIYSDAGRF